MSSRVTPMVRQYQAIKARYPDALLFFRLGDFYEMFGEDAVTASRVLDITLTSREFGKGERVPMCGVPHHAADGYVATLVARGFKVAICDQLEDPRQAKGVVHRDVTRVITPGTVTLTQALEAKAHRWLVAVCRHLRSWGVAALDASTGEFRATQIEGPDADLKLREEILRLQPAELLLGPGAVDQVPALLGPEGSPDGAGAGDSPLDAKRGWGMGAPRPLLQEYDPRAFQRDEAYRLLTRHFQTESLHPFGLEDRVAAIRAAGAALAYLGETQRTSLAHVTTLSTYEVEDHMGLDENTRRNLELTARLWDGQTAGTLLWVLDRTVTSMGGRLLRTWVERPLVNRQAIEDRLDMVEFFVRRHALRAALREALMKVADLERLLGRVAAQSAHARDLLSLARSLEQVPLLKGMLEREIPSQQEGQDGAAPLGPLQQLMSRLDGAPDVTDEISRALVEDPPVALQEGGLIRDGYDEEVDRLRSIRRSGEHWISALEEKERERTGIRSLKIGYNRVFGYYIEVTRPNLSRVPPDYLRRQTLRHAERFITPELKEQEAQVLGAGERLVAREYELFVNLREMVKGHIPRLQGTARALAELDTYLSLADVAVEHRYCRPRLLEEDGPLRIIEGRHPVVEVTRREQGFVANDIEMAPDGARLIVLTGPNMAGKSTYLRQTALIVLMAQMGSFVPATSACIPIVDRLFTRIGAADDVGAGRSTFMVEMNEAAYILRHATPRSLVLLDELGRGTSTYDGMALAQAIAEYLHDTVRAKTILSTHYHELTRLGETLPYARNFHAAVREQDGHIFFLHRIVPGPSDRSYGVNVARMAGLPEPVLRRARRLLRQWETRALDGWQGNPPGQLAFADLIPEEPKPELPAAAQDVLDELGQLTPEGMTPLQALQLIDRWHRQLTAEGAGKEGGR